MNNLQGYTVIKNELLPERTMMVSPDLYLLLKETPEQRAARESQELQSVRDLAQRVDELTVGGRS